MFRGGFKTVVWNFGSETLQFISLGGKEGASVEDVLGITIIPKECPDNSCHFKDQYEIA